MMSERLRISEGWGVLLLCLGLAMVVSLGISSAGWTLGMELIPIASLGGFIIGLMIAKSLLPGWLGHLFSLIIGFAWSFRLVATLFPPDYTWNHRWAWLWWYIYQWILTLTGGGVSRNNLIFILQMAFIVWLVTYLTMWFVFRTHRAWLAIVPGCVLLLINVSYAPKDITGYLLVYLVLAFLLVIRFNLFMQAQTWRHERVHFNADEVSFDFLRAGALFIVVIMALAWITPSVAVAQEVKLLETLRGPWRDMQAEWSRLFASLNYRPNSNVDFYSQTMNLGGPRELSEVPVLKVEAPPSARYWRAVVFDEFTGRGWNNNNDTLSAFGADNQPLALVTYQAQQLITQTFTVLGPSMSVLPMAAQPLWVDRPTRAGLSYVSVAADRSGGRLVEEGTSLKVETISFARSRIPLDEGDRYTVNSLQSQASVRQLRRAGTDYPDWVTQRYLQLPDSVPDRVKQLAQAIAEPFDAPYDQASAIENYLRRRITYNEKIEAPPPDRDPVDYILFDLKQGYCDYYASAMVVMLRSLGIPSRIVSGYAQGRYDPARQGYVVLLQDAHTWVEVFFPKYGWIEFEPTSAQPAIVRPTPSQDANAEQNPDQGPNAIPTPDSLDRKSDLLDQDLPPNLGGNIPLPWWSLNPGQPGAWLGGVVFLLALAGATVWLVGNRRTAGLSSVGAIYHNMLRLAGWAGARINVTQTPHEHASAVGRILPESERPARHIAGLYTRERYGHKACDEREQAMANESWRKLRPRLVRASILRQVRRRLGR